MELFSKRNLQHWAGMKQAKDGLFYNKQALFFRVQLQLDLSHFSADLSKYFRLALHHFYGISNLIEKWAYHLPVVYDRDS